MTPDQLEDPTRRVTQEELEQGQLTPEAPINPLGTEGELFPYAPQGSITPATPSGVQQNVNNRSWQDPRYADMLQQRKKQKRDEEQQQLQKDREDGLLTPELEAKVDKIKDLIAQKKFARALAMIAFDPELRAAAKQLKAEIQRKMALDRVKKELKRLLMEEILAILTPLAPFIAIGLAIIALIIGFIIMNQPPIPNPPNSYPIAGLSGQDLPTEFNPNLLMSDNFFINNTTLDEAGIRAFLKKMNSPLLNYTPDQLGTGANGRDAAKIIYDATRGTKNIQLLNGTTKTVTVSVNPMMILAMLEKEQSLVTQNLPERLHKAMGVDCPGSGAACPAHPQYAGFAPQVEYGAAIFLSEPFKVVRRDGFRSAAPRFRIGNVVTISSQRNLDGAKPGPAQGDTDPEARFHVDNIRISNAATATLYGYTPFVRDGNFNLWRLLNQWFRTEINAMSHDPSSKAGSVVAIGDLKIDTSLSLMDTISADKKGKGNPTAVVMHYLGTSGSGILNAQDAAAYFRNLMQDGNESNNKRVHYIVAQDGTIYQLLTNDTIGAGALGFNTFNGHPTISIENEGHFEDGVASHNYTKAQLESNVKLVKYLTSTYSIPYNEVISHNDVDVCKRHLSGSDVHRTDPGTAFMNALFAGLGQTYTSCH